MRAGHDTKYPSTNSQEMHVVRVSFNVNHRFGINRSSGCLKSDFLSLFELLACFINAWGVKSLQWRRERNLGMPVWRISFQPTGTIPSEIVVNDFSWWNATRSNISWVFFAVDMSPFVRGDIFLNLSDFVRFEGLERLTSTIASIENNGTISEGIIKIAAWDSQDFLEMLHELWEQISSTMFKLR